MPLRSPGAPAAGARRRGHCGEQVPARGGQKFGKGLGIVGTEISGYDNIRKDGLAKGSLETLGGAASTYGASALA